MLFEVDSVDLAPGRTHEADVKLVGNSGQSFTGRVRLTIQGEPAKHPVARGPVPSWLIGAAAAGIARLVLAAPADIGARFFLGAGETAIGQSPLWWGTYTVDQGTFVRHVLITCGLAPRRCNYALKKGMGCTICAASCLGAAGLAVSASLACRCRFLTPCLH